MKHFQLDVLVGLVEDDSFRGNQQQFSGIFRHYLNEEHEGLRCVLIDWLDGMAGHSYGI